MSILIFPYNRAKIKIKTFKSVVHVSYISFPKIENMSLIQLMIISLPD